jgi:hypothetical protein
MRHPGSNRGRAGDAWALLAACSVLALAQGAVLQKDGQAGGAVPEKPDDGLPPGVDAAELSDAEVEATWQALAAKEEAAISRRWPPRATCKKLRMRPRR